jgi:hypothetical protein
MRKGKRYLNYFLKKVEEVMDKKEEEQWTST